MDGLDDQVIEASERSDALTADGAKGPRAAARAREPPPARAFEEPLPATSCAVREMVFGGDQLGTVRRILTRWAGEEQLPAAPTEELVLAVNELATNSIRYGGGGGKLLLWRESDALVCEVRDEGHIEDPLIGRSRPAPNQHTGRGLWLVHQLCDLVEIHSTPGRTAVRVHKHAAPS